ncbi:hypothetical protein [Pseudarthrobacter sulfonivorans]|nr:hypothetical protein [Pseudarthrobacter sulfonivorans]
MVQLGTIKIGGNVPYDNTDDIAISEWLFCHTFEDLEARTAQEVDDRYTLLGCAPLLRKLLMDRHPLLEQANSQFKLPMNFVAHELKQTNPHGPDSASKDWAYWMQGAFIVPGHDKTPLRSYDLRKWLTHRIGVTPAGPITVRDLIKFTSHVEGGVHAGTPSTPVEKSLRRPTRWFLSEEIPAEIMRLSPVGQLKEVAHITLSAAKPLYILLRSGFADEYRIRSGPRHS